MQTKSNVLKLFNRVASSHRLIFLYAFFTVLSISLLFFFSFNFPASFFYSIEVFFFFTFAGLARQNCPEHSADINILKPFFIKKEKKKKRKIFTKVLSNVLCYLPLGVKAAAGMLWTRLSIRVVSRVGSGREVCVCVVSV